MSTGTINKNSIVQSGKALLYVPGVENVGGFVFDISGTAQHTLESDITDHYVEDNTAIQDHWALKPESIVLKNYQGELVYANKSLPTTKNKVPVKLSVSSVIVPNILPQTQQNQKAINIIQNNNNNANIDTSQTDLASQFQGIKNSTGATRQQKAYQFFKTIRANRTLITVVTPYGTFNNIAIANIVPFQDEDTEMMSTFTLTLKEMRFAGYQTVGFNPNTYQGAAATQNAPLVVHRAQGIQLTPPTTNALNSFLNGLTNNPSSTYTSQEIQAMYPTGN